MKFLAYFLLFLINGALTSTTRQIPQLGRPMRDEFMIDSDFIPLNHGAYGTYPKVTFKALHDFQERAEKNLDLWLRREVRPEWDKSIKMLADLINADPADVTMVPNTTGGINAVFRSLVFAIGERILHISTIFNSMNAIISYLIDNSNGTLSREVFNATYPMTNDQFLAKFEAFLENITDPQRPIRIALVDHISAQPAVVIPLDKVIPMLHKRNITVLVDGAHAIGQIPINITALAPDYYVTNCHKWLYSARGCALLYVDKKHLEKIHPAHITSGYKNPADFQEEFYWTGTIDYSPYMTVPTALQFRQDVGGEEVIMNYTHNLVRQGGALLASKFETEMLQYPDQTGSMINVRLPLKNPNDPRLSSRWWVDEQLYKRPKTFVPVHKHNGQWWIRVSAQIYNDITDFEYCAEHFLSIIDELQNSISTTKPNVDGKGSRNYSGVIFVPLVVHLLLIFSFR